MLFYHFNILGNCIIIVQIIRIITLIHMVNNVVDAILIVFELYRLLFVEIIIFALIMDDILSILHAIYNINGTRNY